MTFEIRVTPTFETMFASILDQRICKTIVKDIDALAEHPLESGKALVDVLSGCRSKISAGQRYRIVYAVDEDNQIVWLLGVGLRKQGDKKDIYRALQTLAETTELLPHLHPKPSQAKKKRGK